MKHVARALATISTAGLMAAGGAVSSQAAPAHPTTAAPTARSATVTQAATARTETARRLPATKGVDLRITDSRGTVLPGWKVTDMRTSLECYGPSHVGIAKDTHDCGGTATSSFACVPETGRRSVVCLIDPWSRELVRYSVKGTLPVTPRPSWVMPIGVTLADGSQWRIITGGAWWPGPQNSDPLYYNLKGGGVHEALVTGPDGRGPWVIKDGATWYMRRGVLGHNQPKGARAVNQRLATVYYLTR